MTPIKDAAERDRVLREQLSLEESDLLGLPDDVGMLIFVHSDWRIRIYIRQSLPEAAKDELRRYAQQALTFLAETGDSRHDPWRIDVEYEYGYLVVSGTCASPVPDLVPSEWTER